MSVTGFFLSSGSGSFFCCGKTDPIDLNVSRIREPPAKEIIDGFSVTFRIS
jgi:hypothetical protein